MNDNTTTEKTVPVEELLTVSEMIKLLVEPQTSPN